MGLQPPWEVRGLPYDLAEKDFDDVRRVLDTGLPSGRVVRLPDSIRGRSFLFGTHYDDNVARLRKLARRKPLRIIENHPTYPAVLVPDPSISWGPVPIGVVSLTGYLGSAYREDWSTDSGLVKEQLQIGAFFACEVSIENRSEDDPAVRCLALGQRAKPPPIDDATIQRLLSSRAKFPKLHLIPAPGRGGRTILRICLDDTGHFMPATDEYLPNLGIYVSYPAVYPQYETDRTAGDFSPGSRVMLSRESGTKGQAIVVYDTSGRYRAGIITRAKAQNLFDALDAGKELSAISMSGTKSGERCSYIAILAATPLLLEHLLSPRPANLPLSLHQR